MVRDYMEAQGAVQIQLQNSLAQRSAAMEGLFAQGTAHVQIHHTIAQHSTALENLQTTVQGQE